MAPLVRVFPVSRMGLWLAVLLFICAGLARAATACSPKDSVELSDEACARAVQDALVWTGDYAGLVDGNAGPGTLRALAGFKKRFKLPESDGLSAKEFARLVRAGKRKKSEFGFAVQKPDGAGAALGIPEKLVGKVQRTQWGFSWASADKKLSLRLLMFDDGRSLADAATAMKSLPGHTVSYERMREDWFVLSGEDGAGHRFYVRMQGAAPSLRGFSVTYPADRQDFYEPLVIAMSSSFEISADAAPSLIASGEEAGALHRKRPGVDEDAPRPQMPDPWSNRGSDGSEE